VADHFHYHAPYIEVSSAATVCPIVLWIGVFDSSHS